MLVSQPVKGLLAAVTQHGGHPRSHRRDGHGTRHRSSSTSAHSSGSYSLSSADYGAKYPKAVAKIVADADVLLEFYRYPAEHWIHLRTTNPIESTFATVRLRTKVTKGPGSRAAGLAMAYKLIEAAQTRWRAVNAPHLVALVRNGAVFRKGKLLNGPST